MRQESLERLMEKIEEMRTLIDEDPAMTVGIRGALSELEGVVMEKLRDVVWKKYLDMRSDGRD